MSGTSRIISAPVDCWYVFSPFSHCRFPRFQSFSTNQTRVYEEKKSLKSFLKELQSCPRTQRKSTLLFPPLAPLEEGFVLGSSPPPAWTQPPWHGLWHQGADTVSASLTLCTATLFNSHLLDQICCFFPKKRKKKDILSRHLVSRCFTVPVS